MGTLLALVLFFFKFAESKKMPKTLRELELENKLKDLENQILKEQKTVMMRNIFSGKFSKRELDKMDEKLKEAKDGLQETQAALKERQDQIKAKERETLQAKLKIQMNHKRNQRAKKPVEKGKKKKKRNANSAAPA